MHGQLEEYRRRMPAISSLLLIDVSDRVDSIITMMKALSTAMTRRMVGQELEIRISKHID